MIDFSVVSVSARCFHLVVLTNVDGDQARELSESRVAVCTTVVVECTLDAMPAMLGYMLVKEERCLFQEEKGRMGVYDHLHTDGANRYQ